MPGLLRDVIERRKKIKVAKRQSNSQNSKYKRTESKIRWNGEGKKN